MKFPFGTRSSRLKALAFPAGLILTASLLAAPMPPAAAQTAVTTPSGDGYWLVATDGGIFAYGDAGFFGSLGDRVLNSPITGMVPTPTGLGYWLVAADGGIFAFGDAEFFGSHGGSPLNKPIVGMANSGEEAAFSAAGAKGAKGDTGASGPAGAAGVNGANGAAGPSGPAGTNGTNGTNGLNGPPGPAGNPGRDATYVGADWSIIDRNVLGGGDSYLRAGPGSGLAGAHGLGSLGIRTGSPDDKAAFGNTTLIPGKPVKELTDLSFSVFTTKENSRDGLSLANLPNLTFEINPNRTLNPSDYSSLVFIPAAITVEQSNMQWTHIDATEETSGIWALTGSWNGFTACRHNTSDTCSFEEVKAYLDDDGGADAVVGLSVGFSKGRDMAWSGAVDNLVINDMSFDFEPFGVTMTPVG